MSSASSNVAKNFLLNGGKAERCSSPERRCLIYTKRGAWSHIITTVCNWCLCTVTVVEIVSQIKPAKTIFYLWWNFVSLPGNSHSTMQDTAWWSDLQLGCKMGLIFLLSLSVKNGLEFALLCELRQSRTTYGTQWFPDGGISEWCKTAGRPSWAADTHWQETPTILHRNCWQSDSANLKPHTDWALANSWIFCSVGVLKVKTPNAQARHPTPNLVTKMSIPRINRSK